MGICYFSFDSHLHIKSFSLEELCKIQLNIFLYRVCGLLIISTIHTITLQAASLGDGCCLQVLHSHIPSLVASRPSLDILDVMSSVKLVRRISQGPVPRKMVNLNPGLSQILSKFFLSKDMQLKLIKYCKVEPLLLNKIMITQNVTLSNV